MTEREWQEKRYERLLEAEMARQDRLDAEMVERQDRLDRDAEQRWRRSWKWWAR